MKEKISFAEFVGLMALYVALMAMSIDMILPALGLMGSEFSVAHENEMQYVISILFLGFTLGQIIYGPLSDSFGRKKPIYVGILIYIIGDILSLTANNFSIMLFGRFLQGLGAASPRVVSLAIVRDLYHGSDMARVMSFIMTVFIFVPVIAPSIGQTILLFTTWHAMFFIFLTAGIIAIIWTYFRLPETLHKIDIKPFNLKTIWKDFLIVVTNKITMGYTICAGIIFGALIGYLTSSRQIFQEYFAVGKLFPIFFGISALSIGAASITNSMIVKRLGMRLICHHALIIVIAMSAIFSFLLIVQNNHLTIWQFMIFMPCVFFCFGLLFGNLNALAMEPMGHYAGIASAIVGSLSSGISLIIGTIIGQSYNNTLIPIFLGYLSLSVTAFVLFMLLRDKTVV